MRQKLIVAGFIVCIVMAGCKSRFTSTSDSSGPRKYENADPSFEHSGNTGHDTTSLMGIHDSGSVHAVDTTQVSKSTNTTHSITQ